jgi:hypothetical protein
VSEHILKVVPPYFEALLDGSKTFEVRANDRAFQKGDRLILWEYLAEDTVARRSCDRYPCERCNPRAVTATVGFVYAGDPRRGMKDALAPGYVVLALLDVAPIGEQP